MIFLESVYLFCSRYEMKSASKTLQYKGECTILVKKLFKNLLLNIFCQLDFIVMEQKQLYFTSFEGHLQIVYIKITNFNFNFSIYQLFSQLFFISLANPTSGLLQATLVTLYVTYLAFYAVSNVPGLYLYYFFVKI